MLTRSAEWYVRRIRSPERKAVQLVISGASGCGKTHTARAIYRFSENYAADIILAKQVSHWSSLWLDWPEVAESDSDEDFKDRLYEISRARFVVIDDLGSESDRFKNGVDSSRLRRVMTDLEKQKAWAVVTCNGSLAELMERYDIRIADRLRSFNRVEMGDIPSYRKKLQR